MSAPPLHAASASAQSAIPRLVRSSLTAHLSLEVARRLVARALDGARRVSAAVGAAGARAHEVAGRPGGAVEARALTRGHVAHRAVGAVVAGALAGLDHARRRVAARARAVARRHVAGRALGALDVARVAAAPGADGARAALHVLALPGWDVTGVAERADGDRARDHAAGPWAGAHQGRRTAVVGGGDPFVAAREGEHGGGQRSESDAHDR